MKTKAYTVCVLILQRTDRFRKILHMANCCARMFDRNVATQEDIKLNSKMFCAWKRRMCIVNSKSSERFETSKIDVDNNDYVSVFKLRISENEIKLLLMLHLQSNDRRGLFFRSLPVYLSS